MVVISPHLDDAVFGCGRLLAARPGSIVVTVFAGAPADGDRLTGWDTSCGFASAREAVQARREEDRRALALLGAEPRWLPFADAQYGQTPALHEIAQALHALLRGIDDGELLYPLGLFHSDHRLVHDAARAALQALGRSGLAYEDALYRGMPGLLQQRLAELAAAGVRATPARFGPAGDAALKAQAVQAYASQLRAFGPGGVDDTAWPERCWRLEPRA
jgi:LmbE family N-acetylglucosaminyl deacetylase